MVSEAAKSVTKNVAVLSFTRVITTSSTLLLMVFLPRYLGAVGYGRLYLGQSIVGIFALLIEFGGNYSIMKAVARHPDETGSIFVNSIGVRVFLWVVSFALMMIYAMSVGYPTDVVLIVGISGVGSMWAGFNNVIGNCYRGVELMKYPSFAAIAETVFIATAGITALLLGVGPVGYATISVLGTLSGSIVLARFRWTLFASLPRVDWSKAIAMLKEGLPYFLNTVFGVIYYRIDTVMLSLLAPEQVVGWYAASYRFFDSLMVIPVVFTVSIFPVMSRRWGTNAAVESLMMQKSLDVILMTAIPMAIGAFAFSPQIIHIFFGATDYEPSIMILKIFSVGLILLYVDFILGTVLLSSDQQNKMLRMGFLAIFVNVGLNYLMIPYAQERLGNGGIGSAVATLATELFVMANMLSLIPRRYFTGNTIRVQLKTIVSGSAMIASLFVLQQLGTNWIISAIGSSSVYATALAFLRVFSESDKALARSILGSLVPRLGFSRSDA